MLREVSRTVGSENSISLLREKTICRYIYSPGIICGPQEESFKFRLSLHSPEGSQSSSCWVHTLRLWGVLTWRGRLVSSQCTAALGKEIFGQRCGLNPGHVMCSANLLVVSLARTWGCAHVHRSTYAFHLLLCGSRHRSCFSCVGSVIYCGSCIVRYCLQ